MAPSVLPDDGSVLGNRVPRLGSGRTTTLILIVPNIHGLAHAVKSRSIRGMGLHMDRIALVGGRYLGQHNSICDRAAPLARIFSSSKTLADRGAARHFFRKILHRLVPGMTVTNFESANVLFVTGIRDRLSADRPKTLLQFRRACCTD